MGRTPQRFHGAALEDDSIQFDDRGTDVDVVGSLWRLGDDLYGRDSVGKFNLRNGGSGGSSDDVKRLLISTRGHVLHDTTGELVLKVGP